MAAVVGAVVVGIGALSGCSQDSAEQPSGTTASATRVAAAAITCPELGGPKDLPSYADFNTKYAVPITVINSTSAPLTINTSEIDCYDFSGVENPSVLDGAQIAAGATGGPYTVIARRTCAYIKGDIIGNFQVRKARWLTTVSLTEDPSAKGVLPTTIECSSYEQSPTMCRSGAGQDSAAYTVKLSNGSALRADYVCVGTDTTLTLSDLY